MLDSLVLKSALSQIKFKLMELFIQNRELLFILVHSRLVKTFS